MNAIAIIASLRSGFARGVLLLCLGLAAPFSRAAVTPAGWLAEGSPSATPFFARDSGTPGPTVLIVSGMHGDEVAGPEAAEQILAWPVARGKLIVVPRANVRALAARKRLTPGEAGNAGNLNRAFPPMASGAGATRQLAAAIWSLVQAQKPGWLLDLHEGGGFHGESSNTVGSSVIAAPAPEAQRAAQAVRAAVNATLTEPRRQFALLRQPIKGSLARAAADDLGVRSMIVETTIKGQPLALRSRQHRIAVHAVLRHLEMLTDAVTPELMTDPARGGVRVAVYDGAGNGGTGVSNVLRQLGIVTNVLTRRVCPEDIRAGVLKQFDAVLFTGGSGSGQADALGGAGRDAVKQFVANGGGYLGICAGAYLACDGFPWGLGIIDAKTLSPLWRRGTGQVKLELTEKGRAILGDRREPFDCLYFQGPIVGPAGNAALPDYEPLAFFRTEVAKNNTPKGIMVNSPAVFAGRFGQGRVLCFSPHPEQTAGLDTFVPRAMAWVSAPP